jgi:DNA replication protein DnaC
MAKHPHPKRRRGGFTHAASAAPTIDRPVTREFDGPPQGSCGVCSGGLISVNVAISGGPYKAGATRSFAYRCLCAFGQRKSPQVFGADVRSVLADVQIAELFPDGVPTVQVVGPNMTDAMAGAGVPPVCVGWTFTSYADKFPDPDRQKFLRRATDWIAAPLEERPDVVLFGPNGTGKTGLAIAMGRAVLEGNETLIFSGLKLLATRWRSTYGRKPEDGKPTAEENLLDVLVGVDLLVVDEIGGTRLSEFVEDTLTLVVDMRQKSAKPTVLTVNVKAEGEPSQEMAAILGPALFDRLRERAQFWPLMGKSARRPSLPMEAK